MKFFTGLKKIKTNLKEFESFDYRAYLSEIGLNMLKFKEECFNNLPNDAVILRTQNKAFAVLTERKWDQKILGCATYSIDYMYIKRNVENEIEVMERLIRIIINYVVKNGIRLLILRFSSEKIKYLQLFEKYGFITTDMLSTFLFDSKKSSLGNRCSDKIRIAKQKDYSDILRISKDSFEYSRIYTDNFISRVGANKFYSELTKSVLEKKGNLKLVFEDKGRILGFAIGSKAENMSMFFDKKIGHLWLISVLKGYRRKNIAGQLLNEFLMRFSKEVDFIEISTQINNVPAVRLYSSFGLCPLTYIITMHYWNKK